MRGHLFGAALAGAFGLFAAPLPAQAVPTCPTNGLCIDESVEGQTPILTAPAGFGTSITTLAEPVGEGWTVTFTFPTGTFTSISLENFALSEPGSGLLSDALPFVLFQEQEGSPAFLSFTLLSDNELGQIATTQNCCLAVVEDGTFQFTHNSFTQSGITYDLYLKSDVKVPEPVSLVLFGSALVGFGVIRRRRTLRWRTYEVTS